jgi:FkbM family methyltransferase
MRLPVPSYRFLFFLSIGLTVVTLLASAIYSRRMDASAKRANEELNELNPLAISAHHHRDKEFTYTVENYGFLYRGTTGNLIDDSVLMYGAWEKEILFFLNDYVRAVGATDTAFIDVGANTGIYSLFMSSRVKQVHAIEPFPPILNRLHENIRLNKFTNVTVHELGYGAAEAQLPFFAPEDVNQGTGTFRDDGTKEHSYLKIVAGDDHLRTVTTGPIGVMKVDIEGYEESALKGLRQTLEKHRPLVMLEVSTPLHNGTIASFDQLKSLFPANYEFFIFVPCERGALNGHYDLQEFAPRAANFFATDLHKNLIVVPAEHAPKMPRRNWSK